MSLASLRGTGLSGAGKAGNNRALIGGDIMQRIALALFAFLVAPFAALAQGAWPQKPVTFVVSNGAGSAPDVMARMLAAKLEPILGQSIVIETRAGGGNVIGALNVEIGRAHV